MRASKAQSIAAVLAWIPFLASIAFIQLTTGFDGEANIGGGALVLFSIPLGFLIYSTAKSALTDRK